MSACRNCLAVACLVALVSCADRRRDDAELGGLVHAEAEKPTAIDVDEAATDVEALVAALAVPHHQLELGAHRITATSSVEVSSRGEVLEALSDKTSIAVDDKGNFVATADNDREYGRHAIFVDGVLYLRPRYGKYHAREPDTPSEPGRILDQMFSTASAYFDLLWTGAELSDRGATSIDGRAAKKIEISKAPQARDRPDESVRQRAWRESIGVDEVAGEVILDRETGAPLSVKLAGTIHYTRDGVRHEMKLAASHKIEVGAAPAIKAPAETEAVGAPTVSGEVAEREKLLEGLSSSTGSDPE